MTFNTNVAPWRVVRPKPQPWTCPAHGKVAKHFHTCPTSGCKEQRP